MEGKQNPDKVPKQLFTKEGFKIIMMNDELKKIIDNHEKWLECQETGERADLRGANLCNADLCNADLRGADMCDANLCDANLCDADLRGANLCNANLRGADLRCADLRNANLRGADLCNADLCNANLRTADLRGADLCNADLCNADLRGAYLRGANLCDANLCDADLRDANLCDANLRNANLRNAILRNAGLIGVKDAPFIPMTCPDSGSFTAWKKAHGYIVKLLIPEDARRSSATGRKCRCDKAVVVAIEAISGEPSGIDEIESDYDITFIYKVGETVTEPNFCVDRFIECTKGIHFFISRQEAVDYN